MLSFSSPHFNLRVERRAPRVPERVGGLAGAVLVADEPVEARGAEAVPAAGPLEALGAEAGPIDVVALGPVLTVALVGALRPVSADRAFVPAPGGGVQICV